MYLRRIDLNLLVVFDVLMQERSITRGAARLNMSQPAVSHALSRLRQQLDDPLLVRAGDTMQASPRALELHGELRQALGQIEQSLSPRPHFDPAASEREFTIATTDYVEALLLPPLLKRLQQQAPAIRLQIRHLPYQLPLDELENGAIDMAIGRAELVPKRFRTELLLEDCYLCALSKRHELVGKPLTLERYAGLEHLLVAPESKRRQLARSLFPGGALEPKIIANLPHFLVALAAVGESDFVLTGPERLLRKFEQAFGLYLTAPPFDMPPFQISLVWNRLNEADQGLRWLREQLVDIAVKELS